MTKEEQQTFRPRIETRIQEIRDSLAATAQDREAISPDASIGRLSRLDSMQMQQLALGVQTRMKEEISRLQEALGRIDRGIFGTCELCRKDISAERLDYQPDAAVCVDCLNRPRRRR